MTAKPQVDEEGKKELKKVDAQFTGREKAMREAIGARSSNDPVQETEPQTKLSSNEIKNSKDIYLKPSKTLPDRQKFNEAFRKEWDFAREYVHFIAEHKELIGETLEFWTHPFGGVGAEYWEVPTNRPVWAPRYVAEQIKRKSYYRAVAKNDKVTSSDGVGAYYTNMVVDTKVQRLDAYPVSSAGSHFGSRGF